MSALETMVRTVLGALDLDVDQVKGEVTSRIKAFEANLATLNATLISLDARMSAMEKNMAALCDSAGIEYQTTKGTNNDARGIVPSITGPKADN